MKMKIAFLHRYGLGGWICCGGHCIPRMFEILIENGCEIHFFGPRSMDPTPASMNRAINVHQLSYTWNRSNPMHKWSRTIMWYIYLPWLAIYCRVSKMDALIYIDDTLPLTGWIFRILYGRNFAMTVMDFFVRIYTQKHPVLRPLCSLVEWLDYEAWKRTPVLFTKVYYTQRFLEGKGIARQRMYIARNPCNQTIFHPVPSDERQKVREQYGLSETDIVLSHHGILHPNKGNDWIIERMAELRNELPHLKLILAGDGPEMGNLKKLADRKGLSQRIVFTGWLPTEKSLNDAINAADLGLVMRIGQETDHFHMTDTLTHEMACGKPTLAVRLEGIMEVIKDGDNGLLFDPADTAEFNEKLAYLYNNPSKWNSLGNKALATIGDISNLETCATQLATPILKMVNLGK